MPEKFRPLLQVFGVWSVRRGAPSNLRIGSCGSGQQMLPENRSHQMRALDLIAFTIPVVWMSGYAGTQESLQRQVMYLLHQIFLAVAVQHFLQIWNLQHHSKNRCLIAVAMWLDMATVEDARFVETIFLCPWVSKVNPESRRIQSEVCVQVLRDSDMRARAIC